MQQAAALSVIFGTLVTVGLLPFGVKSNENSYWAAQAIPSANAAFRNPDSTTTPTETTTSLYQLPEQSYAGPTETSATSSRSMHRYERSYHRVWQLVKDNYYDRTKLENWSSWKHRFDGHLASKSELHDALNSLLSSLHDDYTYTLSERQVQDNESQTHMHKVAYGAILSGNIGYVKLRNFCSEHVENDFNEALSQIGGTSGIILDLRGNHGGYIEKAQRLFALLADKGAFMSYSGYQDGITDSKVLRLTPVAWDILQNGTRKLEPRELNEAGNRPIIVLVNDDTRSAAELLAGALRGNNRAIMVGTKTFGKGVLQDKYDIGNNMQVKITTAKYFLPNGENIHNKGLQPDIVVQQDGDGDSQLNKALNVLTDRLASEPSAVQRKVAAASSASHSLM